MASKIHRAEYFYTTVKDEPGEAYRLLSTLEQLGINLMAFTCVPVGLMNTQLTIFPEDAGQLVREARKAGLPVDGPYPALLVQGDDELGALVDVHMKLYERGVNVYASNGVADGKGSYGYVIYVRPEEFDRATEALGV